MLNTISEKFHSWTTGWRVIIMLIADALMMGYIMPLAGGPSIHLGTWFSFLVIALAAG